MAVLKNRAKMSTSTTGTGTITLGSAEDGYQTFADAGVANADVVRYVIEDGSNFEIGTGTYTSSGTTLSRTVSESSNSDAAINLSGSATVFIGATAEDIELSGNMAGDILSNGHAIKLGDRSSSDVNELIMGAGGDFRLYHNGSTGHSLITETGSGNLQIAATNIELKAASGHALLTATYGGSVDLYYNSSKKAETTSSGLQTTGTLNVNGAYTLPTSDGTNGQVLTTDGSGAVTFADAGGGADLYAANESSPTAQPSATGTNAIAIGDSAVSSNTNSTAVGAGAIASGNSSFAGTNSRVTGSDSVAFGVTLNSTSYGALSHKCFVAGYGAKATNMFSTAIGAAARAEGTYVTTIGDNAKILGGNYNSAFGAYSEITSNASSALVLGHKAKSAQQYATAIGYEAYSDIIGKYAYASGKFSAYGDALGGMYILRADTTDATATVLTTNNSTAAATNQIVAASDTCIMFSGTLVAMQNGAQDQGGWEIKGLLKNDGGTTTLVSSNIQTFADGNGWVVALTADNTNNALAITCTGEAAHNIRWVANIQTSEVTYA